MTLAQDLAILGEKMTFARDPAIPGERTAFPDRRESDQATLILIITVIPQRRASTCCVSGQPITTSYTTSPR